MGGPLIVIPVSALAAWRGCAETGIMAGDATDPDYDRACAVDGPAGVIAVGENGAQALVLADEQATLMDSAESGAELDVEHPGGGMPAKATVPLPAGRWKVRATHTRADKANRVGLVHILPVEA